MSEVTAPTAPDSPDDIAPTLTDADMALLVATEKKSARKKTWENTGRKRRRGGQEKEYYQKWAGKEPSYGWKKKAASRPRCLHDHPF